MMFTTPSVIFISPSLGHKCIWFVDVLIRL